VRNAAIHAQHNEGKAMNKYSILFGALIVAASTGTSAVNAHDEGKGTAPKSVYVGTVTGVISDSMCKFDHTAMIKSGHGKDAASCTKKCVSDGNKLVLADKKDNTVYSFSNSKLAKAMAGKSVSVTGHIDPETKVIHIHSIKAQ
jgi:hypothetical protein